MKKGKANSNIKHGSMPTAFRAAASGASQAGPITPTKQTAKFSPIVSMRVSKEERAQLEREAAGTPLSAYLRERLLGQAVTPRKTLGKFPVKDHEALACVLGRLGRSEVYNNLHRLLLTVEEGRVPLEPDIERELRRSCAEVAAMRADLVRALGLQSK